MDRLIPAGVTIECPTYAINYDDEIYNGANSFDAFRFYNMREKARSRDIDASTQNQFVSVNQNSLVFGYGRHACPGRFFAGNKLKIIVAVALTCFDLKQTEGSTARYPDMEFAQMVITPFSRLFARCCC